MQLLIMTLQLMVIGSCGQIGVNAVLHVVVDYVTGRGNV